MWSRGKEEGYVVFSPGFYQDQGVVVTQSKMISGAAGGGGVFLGSKCYTND